MIVASTYALALALRRGNMNMLQRSMTPNIKYAPAIAISISGGRMSQKPKKPAGVVAGPKPAAEVSRLANETTCTPGKAAQGYYDEMATLSQDNFDAVLKANTALAEGLEAIANEAVGFVRQTLATAGTATKELLEAKTLDRVIEIQTDLAKNGLETIVERTARLSELNLALANGAWRPIGSRFEATLTTLAKPVVV